MSNKASPSFLKTKKTQELKESEDDDYIDIKLLKKRKKRYFERYEKFKSKNIINLKNEPSLKGAENKVKSILSSFLLTIESEDERNNQKIKFLRDKLSTKKAKIIPSCEKKSKKNVENCKPNSLFVNGLLFEGNNNINNGSDSLLASDDKRTHKENHQTSKKKIIANNKIKISNLKLNKYYLDSKSKSSLIDSNFSQSNFKKSSDNKSSLLGNEECLNKKKINYNINNHLNKVDKYKLHLKKASFKMSKKSLGINEYISSKHSSRNVESSLTRNSIASNNRDSRRSLNVPNKINNCNDPFLQNSLNNMNLDNNSKLFKQISLNKDKIKTLKKFGDKYNIIQNIGKNEKKKKTFHSKRINLNLASSGIKNYKRVESVLKDLQEKIKNSIILRPADLKSNDENLVKRKSKVGKDNDMSQRMENKFSKKEISSFNSQRTKFSKNNLIENDIEKENKNPKESEEKKQTKNKLSLKNFDIFKGSDTDLQKTNSEIDVLKSKFNEDISANQLPNYSSMNNPNITKERYRIITHKKLIYDSLDDEEIEDEFYDYYINPESNFSLIFDAIILFVSIYSFIYFPYYLAHSLTFCQENFFSLQRIFNIFIELVYIFDFIFGFFRAYYNFEEQLIKKHSSVIKKYLSGWFLFDLICAIPIYSILKFKEKKCEFFINAHYYNYILHNLNYLYLLNRILKIIKSIMNNQAYNYIYNLLNNCKYYNQISLIFQILFILSIFHFSSCIYIFIGRNSYPNWIFSTKLEEKNFSDIYICGIYILITALTTVGYGDITCYSSNERIFQLILLIVGIMAYSFIISFFSNYVKKINEESIDFENRKAILDEIKLTNPNFTNNLYDKILRYLKYKRFHENKDKSIIFECLPSSLKNNLIVEMYKPIIKNFIFFKNFQNLDFMVRVVLSFRPILAIKNDILVNEGDFVEDIIFVKKGVLTVELALNMKNPEENIDKYINNITLEIKRNYSSNLWKSSMISQGGVEGLKNILSYKNTLNKDNALKSNIEKTVKQMSYVKILNIRENEHFGDVLMFLEQRSPLRVRVRSKKSELFFLRKIDAINISSSYQNIWSRINKKSVYNFKQIKKSIIKIVELYCSYKNIKRDVKIVNNPITKNRRTSMIFLKMKKNSFLLDKSLTINKHNSQKDLKAYNKFSDYFYEDNTLETSINLKVQSSRTFSTVNDKTKTENTDSLLNIFDIENSHNINGIKNRNSINKNKSLFTKKRNNASDNLNENENVNNNLIIKNNGNNNKIKYNNYNNKALMNVYKGNYKYYEMNNILNAKTIITEEPEDSMLRINTGLKSNFLKISSINNNKTSKISSIISISHNQIDEKGKEEKEKEEKDNKDNKNIIKNSKKSFFLSSEKSKVESSKLENSNSVFSDGLEKFKNKYIINRELLENKEKSNLINLKNSSSSLEPNNNQEELFKNQVDNESNNIHFRHEINEEIYPGEILNIPNKGENLMNKKVSLSEIEKNEKIIENKNSLNENSKLRFLLESIKEKKTYEENDDSIESNQKNNLTDVFPNKKSKKILFKLRKKLNEKNENNNSNLSIESDIKIEILSIYDNINKLSNFRFYNNKSLQLKVKNILQEKLGNELNSSSSSSDNDNFQLNKKGNKSVKSIIKLSQLNKTKTISSTKLPFEKKREKSFICNDRSFFHNNNLFSKKKSKNINNKRKTSVFIKRGRILNDELDSELLRHIKFSQTKVYSSIYNSNNNSNINNSTYLNRKYSQANRIGFSNLNKENSKILNNKAILVSNNDNFKKRKNTSLLSKINFNIEKTNQNLNNPDEFYSNYFQSLLEGEKQNMDKEEKKRFSSLADNIILSPKHNKINRVKTKLNPKQSFLAKIYNLKQ